MHHLCFIKDWTNNKKECSINGQMLRKLTPAWKTITTSSILNLGLWFSMTVCVVHRYYRLHHRSKFGKGCTNDSKDSKKAFTRFKNHNLFQHPASSDSTCMPVDNISIITQIIHASMVKFGSAVIKIWLSKCTCSKILNLLQYLKHMAHNTQGCWLHRYYTMYQSCKFGEFITSNNWKYLNPIQYLKPTASIYHLRPWRVS